MTRKELNEKITDLLNAVSDLSVNLKDCVDEVSRIERSLEDLPSEEDLITDDSPSDE